MVIYFCLVLTYGKVIFCFEVLISVAQLTCGLPRTDVLLFLVHGCFMFLLRRRIIVCACLSRRAYAFVCVCVFVVLNVVIVCIYFKCILFLIFI